MFAIERYHLIDALYKLMILQFSSMKEYRVDAHLYRHSDMDRRWLDE